MPRLRPEAPRIVHCAPVFPDRATMSFTDYKSFWDAKATTPEGAMAAVDGSTDEGVLRATGGYSARQVAAALELTTDDRVLELGCGVGRIGRELAERVGHWHGVDISSNMVE